MEESTGHKIHYAWWILIACCAIQAGSQGVIYNTYGIFISPVCSELGFKVGSFSLAQTFSAVAMMIAQPFAIYLYNKFDMRKVLLASGIIYFACQYCFSLSNMLWHWYILLAIQGMAGGLFYRTSYMILICNWFASKAATALGIATAVGSIMGMLMGPVSSLIIANYGWRYCYVILATLGALITLPIIALVVKAKPLDIGLKPYVEDTIEGVDTTFPPKIRGKQMPLACSLLFVSVALSFLSGGYYPHIANYCISIGMSITAGSIMTSFELGGTTVIQLIIGPLLDKLGFIKVECMLLFLSIGGFLGYFAFTGNMLFVTTALCGMYCATNAVIMPLFAREQFGEEQSQKILPWLVTIGAASSSVSNSIYGYLFDWLGNYNLMFIICIFGAICSFGLLMIIKRIGDAGSCNNVNINCQETISGVR